MDVEPDDHLSGPWGRATPGPPPRPGRMRWRLVVMLGLVLLLLLALWQTFPPSGWRQGSEYRLIYLGVILVALVARLAASRRSLAGIMAQLGIWAATALVIVASYSYRDELGEIAGRIRAELMPGYGQQLAGGAMTFIRSPDHQFWIDATVDDKPVRFLLDTGATDLVLNREDAARLGFSNSDLSFTESFDTANGRTRGASIRLKEIRIGSIDLKNVPAWVNEGRLGESLMGMEVLERFGTIEIHSDRLTIRP